jgi:shikimate kinase
MPSARASASIVLIGFMGTGKSSVGRILAQRVGWPKFDTDEMVIAKAGMPITEIFEQRGEAYFRDLETAALRAVPHDRAAIIVTGGGIILRPENVALLRALGVVVCLTADEGALFRRISRKQTRPLLQTENPREKMRELLQIRAPIYKGAAQFTVDTSSLTHAEVAVRILAEVKRAA